MKKLALLFALMLFAGCGALDANAPSSDCDEHNATEECEPDTSGDGDHNADKTKERY